ncbi:MAG: hydroxysqualene dehydroxylase HpnE [Candidatus Sulfotelmatobacter sp.]
MPSSPQPTVAIAGGGLAGLAAACALSDSGFKVTLFEKRPFLGGRASSYEHPGTGEVVDNCQHVLFRLCTNLIEFYERIGVADQIRWFDQMNFIEPGGRTSIMKSSFLPAPLHTAPSFWNFSFLSPADKLSISRALMPLTLHEQRDTGKSFQQWLDHHGQSATAVERFWRPILISALSEELDHISISAAAQVIRESMKSRAARQMGVPTVPLTDLYNAAGDYVQRRGGVLHFRQPIEQFQVETAQVTLCLRNQVANPAAPLLAPSARTGDSSDVPDEAYDYLVLALPFDALDRVLPNTTEGAPLREQISRFENSPITGIHLWFDRQISDLDHAVLLDRTIQWMFHKSRLQPMRTQSEPGWRSASSAAMETAGKERASAPAGGSYIELVVSSSKSLIEKSRAEIVELAIKEVREFFPAARDANLVKSTVIKEVNATYSPRPGIDAHRPSAITAWPRIFLAGDWTATGWPATMEGAVRSGYLAAEAVAHAAGVKNARFISPDLPPTGFMRLFT